MENIVDNPETGGDVIKLVKSAGVDEVYYILSQA
jgi:hypothetical protein